MNPILLYKIIEYMDKYDIATLFNIDPEYTNIQDLLDIHINTTYMNKHIESKKWKNIFTEIVLKEFKQLRI